APGGGEVRRGAQRRCLSRRPVPIRSLSAVPVKAMRPRPAAAAVDEEHPTIGRPDRRPQSGRRWTCQQGCLVESATVLPRHRLGRVLIGLVLGTFLVVATLITTAPAAQPQDSLPLAPAVGDGAPAIDAVPSHQCAT